jgi:hypothetical protein
MQRVQVTLGDKMLHPNAMLLSCGTLREQEPPRAIAIFDKHFNFLWDERLAIGVNLRHQPPHNTYIALSAGTAIV